MMVFVQYLCVRTHFKTSEENRHATCYYAGQLYFFPNIELKNADDFKIVYENDGVTAKTIMVKY